MTFVSDDPMLRLMQGGLLLAGSLMVFLLFYATRDIILRTKSFAYQFASILLVAALPVIGFLIYLLVRPARTVKERQMEAMLKKVIEQTKEKAKQQPQHHHHVPKQEKEKKMFIARQAAAKAVPLPMPKERPLEPVPVSQPQP